MRLLDLSADDADAIFAALATVRPVLRMLGPDARADLDGGTLTIRATLPGTPTFAAEAVETFPCEVAASLPGEAGPPRTGLPITDKPKRIGKAGNPHHKPWSAEDDAQAAALWNDGASAAKIGLALGRTGGAVMQRIKDLRKRGVEFAPHGPGGHGDAPAEPWSEEDDRTLVSMRAAGATFGAIGMAVDRTEGACRMRLKKIEETVPAEPVARAPLPEPVAVLVPRLPEPERSPYLDLTLAQRPIARHLDRMGHAEPWTAARDLDLVQGLLSGHERETVLARVSRAAGVSREAALTRFRDLTSTIRDPRKGLSIDGQAALLALLRDHAAVQSVAAE